ncbi:MAG: hypothetical protein ACMG6E_04805 [Candidatus Roizmanbacteria bacterium]
MDVRKKMREGKMITDKVENEEKQRKKQEEKNAKMFIKTGKPEMQRSKKKELKKVKEVKKVWTEEQLDRKKYL